MHLIPYAKSNKSTIAVNLYVNSICLVTQQHILMPGLIQQHGCLCSSQTPHPELTVK